MMSKFIFFAGALLLAITLNTTNVIAADKKVAKEEVITVHLTKEEMEVVDQGKRLAGLELLKKQAKSKHEKAAYQKLIDAEKKGKPLSNNEAEILASELNLYTVPASTIDRVNRAVAERKLKRLEIKEPTELKKMAIDRDERDEWKKQQKIVESRQKQVKSNEKWAKATAEAYKATNVVGKGCENTNVNPFVAHRWMYGAILNIQNGAAVVDLTGPEVPYYVENLCAGGAMTLYFHPVTQSYENGGYGRTITITAKTKNGVIVAQRNICIGNSSGGMGCGSYSQVETWTIPPVSRMGMY